MKVYTRKGDAGETSLLGGTRVPKYNLRIEAYGTVDELNSYLGLLSTQTSAAPELTRLRHIQDRLFTLGAHLAANDESNKSYKPDLLETDVTALEQHIDEMEAQLQPLKNFVLPGGCAANALAHVCRCVCRRAERLVVQLSHESAVDAIILAYLNRLSDWCFVYARLLTQREGAAEVVWQPRKQ